MGGAVVHDEAYVFPMTVITPLVPSPFQRWRQRFMLAAGRQWPSVRLALLGFIHIAHWAALDKLPNPRRGRPDDRLPTPYIVFVSNFNGARNEYIEMFSDRIPIRINRIYADCDGFPGARPASGLISYLDRHHHDAAVYYAACPEATTRMVIAARHVQDELRRLRDVAPTMSDARLTGEWGSFLRALQRDLS